MGFWYSFANLSYVPMFFIKQQYLEAVNGNREQTRKEMAEVAQADGLLGLFIFSCKRSFMVGYRLLVCKEINILPLILHAALKNE